jgi:hypothetical protein
MVQIHPFKRLNVCLDFLRLVVASETKKSRALFGLGETIADTEEEYRELEKHADDPEFLSDDYHMDMEQLLGVCFMACQQKINSVCGRAYRIDIELDKECKSEDSRKDNLKLGAHSVSEAFSDVETLDALANLFKHYDEWLTNNLNGMPAGARRIVEILKQARVLEVEQFRDKDGNHIPYAYVNTYVLIDAAKQLGNRNLKNPLIFHTMVTEWADEVLRKYEKLVSHHNRN